jgi:hypothetical protein
MRWKEKVGEGQLKIKWEREGWEEAEVTVVDSRQGRGGKCRQ